MYSLFNLGTRWGWAASTTPWQVSPGKETRYPLYRRPSGPQGRSGQLRKISPPPGFDTGPSSPWRVALPTELPRPTWKYVSSLNNSIVGIVTNIWIENSGIRILAGSREFSLPPSLKSTETGILVMEKAVGREADHSHPYRLEVKNVWSHTSTPPTRIHGVDRDDFSFFAKFVMICLMMLLQLLRIRNIEWYGHLFSSNIKGVAWRAYISALRILRHHCVVRNTYSVLKQHEDKDRQNRIVQNSILLTANCAGFPLILVVHLLSSSSL